VRSSNSKGLHLPHTCCAHRCSQASTSTEDPPPSAALMSRPRQRYAKRHERHVLVAFHAKATASHPTHPAHRPPHTSIQTRPQRHQTEPQLPTPRLLLPLQKTLHPKPQCLLAQNILVLAQHAPIQRAFPPPVQLPEVVVGRLDEADVVQVDVGVGRGRRRVALGGGGGVCGFESVRAVEEVGARVGGEGDGGAEEG